MKKQKIREIKLNLLLNADNYIRFMNEMDPETFIEIHQDNFKDHYLKEPKLIISNEIWDDWDLGDIIKEKYIEFFNRKGIDETYKWLNPRLYSNYSEYLKTEDFSKEIIMYEMGMDVELSDDDCELANDLFHELYGETFSGWGLTHFVLHIMELYEYEKENQKENEYELVD